MEGGVVCADIWGKSCPGRKRAEVSTLRPECTRPVLEEPGDQCEEKSK